ncbi:SPFH domain-containing protein [Sphingomonas abietis]|uniref:SPFH domain-containing protein n=1 Tax=Sphingomonas abietis TaxID=3012344 RepID=A0ABY7NSQ1_9SPHN|nr:SPFH domain-containing protein [Sphingomonas abietis]WBO24535.1 SPFH domain-containing protein [Sphingomonas abietis]
MTRILRNPIGWAALLMLFVLACASVFTVVPETKQALIVRMGIPRAVVNLYRADQAFGETGAGLIARVPLLDQVVYIDRRAQTVELENAPLLAADGQRLTADAFARYRIVDPTRLFEQTHGDPHRIGDTLKTALAAALRTELGRLPARSLLAPEGTPQMRAVAAALDRVAQGYGARVSEVRLDRVDLPDGAPFDAVIARMRGAGDQNVAAIRDAGARQAAAIRADGDARAAKAYADAFGQDPQFYDFYRAMQSYQKTLADGSTQFVLSPDSEYLRQFRSGGKQ